MLLICLMFLCAIVSIFCSIVKRKQRWYDSIFEYFAWTSGVFAGIFFLVTCINFGVAIEKYPKLLKDRARVVSLYENIEDVRASRYSGIQGGDFVGGSLDNMSQSTALSEYVSVYATKRAEFNSLLKEIQFKKSVRVYSFVGFYMFVSEKVLEIKPIGNSAE